MKNPSIRISTPLSFKNLKILTNRIVVPPMASETADERGHATQKTYEHYARLTESRAALIMVEYSYVHSFGRSENKQLGIGSDSHLEGLTKIRQIIHAAGSLAAIQLTHAGGKTERSFSADIMQSPSGVIVPVKDQILESSTTMGHEQISEWKEAFVVAAKRAHTAGFDIVELHAAHGYGLNQWLSPITNQREDQYGGSPLKNMRLLIEIIQGIKAQAPGLLLSVRMPGQDFLPGGLTQFDAVFIAKELEAQGVDLLNISSGIGGWRRPRERNGEGYLVEEASFIATHLNIPVIGVGGIETSTYIETVLNTKKIALTAVGRAILKDPRLWAQNQLRSLSYG